MNEQISLKKMILAIQKNIWWLVGIIGVTVLGMLIYLEYIAAPIYQENTQILVNQSEREKKNSLDSQTVEADLQLVNTYSAIILSPRILNAVEHDLGNQYDAQELAEKIQVKNATNSQVINIAVEDPDPQIAAQIANSTAQIFTEELPKIMKIDNVTTLSEAKISGREKPVAPRKTLMMTLAFFVGILFSFGFVFIKLLLDRTFTSSDEVEEFLGLTVLGEVCAFQNDDLPSKNIKGGE
ncbi:YveK family protein [Listeria kieliensis]|uniref:Capsular biosynthesis protein n=1 Tax=Listeria kieliensis TaxID=1621700 RepID=A0A3D8TTQ9_9LIST|nr:Wzz/FepE/Etk N-terminal domain-containing protein [Listeria kieliensis]RDX02222.1 capsular biosynthesis protein [Listeria kieliensis]